MRWRKATHAEAVIGGCSKNSSEPPEQLNEVPRDQARDVQSSKHTSLGILKDILNLTLRDEYSPEFLSRHYRPAQTTMLVAGGSKRNALTLTKLQPFQGLQVRIARNEAQATSISPGFPYH